MENNGQPTNAFVEVAEVQKQTKTKYCAGLDFHPFSGGFKGNYDIYNRALSGEEVKFLEDEVYPVYNNLLKITTTLNDSQRSDLAFMLSSIQCYAFKVINILVKKCNVRVFKPQAGFYEQFGPAGYVLLQKIREYIKSLEKTYGRIICILDCKRGDIATTQTAYILGLMGNLLEDWGIDYSPFDFDIINVTPWMGLDVMAVGSKEKPGIGLKLMQAGKGIIVVNNTSNPTGPRYQKQIIDGERGDLIPLQMLNVMDLASLSKEFNLEVSGLSSIGLVVGSTYVCTGEIRQAFPSSTLLVPGFGAQDGKFSNIMQELIPSGPYAGYGAIFSSSRGTLYSFEKKFGGSGDVKNLEKDLITSITNFRIAEEEAFKEPGLKEKGIIYPFSES